MIKKFLIIKGHNFYYSEYKNRYFNKKLREHTKIELTFKYFYINFF